MIGKNNYFENESVSIFLTISWVGQLTHIWVETELLLNQTIPTWVLAMIETDTIRPLHSCIGVSRYLPGIGHYIPDISRYIPSIIWYFEPCTYFQLSCNSRVMFAIQRYIGVLSSRKHKILQGIKFYIKPLSISSYIHVSTLI